MSSCSHIKISLTEKWKEREREEALLSAAQDGHESCIDLLSLQGADVNHKTKLGETALTVASRLGHTKCVQSLIQAGADVNIPNDSGDTALVLAACRRNIDSVYCLIQAGSDVNHTDELRDKILKLTVAKRHTDCAKLLIAADKNNVLLNDAAQQGLCKFVKTLIEAGADVNKTNIKGETCLIVAVAKGRGRCAELLVKLNLPNADVNKESTKSHTPLVVASDNGGAACVKLLIEAGVDVNQSSAMDNTALMFAAENGNDKCVKLLIEAGADVSTTDSSDRTILFRVLDDREVTRSDYSLAESIKHLVEAGANVNTVRQSLTPLKVAAVTNNVEALKVFIDKGADVNFVGDNSISAVGAAIKHDSAECMEELLEVGGQMLITRESARASSLDENVRNFRRFKRMGVTRDTAAMTYCAFYDSYRCMQILLQEGADVNMIIENGDTALILATKHRSHKCLSKLLEAGANVNMTTSDGKSILMVPAGQRLQYTRLLPGGRVKELRGLRPTQAQRKDINKQTVNRRICLMLLAAGELVKRFTANNDRCDRKLLGFETTFGPHHQSKINLMYICRRVKIYVINVLCFESTIEFVHRTILSALL